MNRTSHRRAARSNRCGSRGARRTYLGHASITITMDRYGHLMPGNETEAVDLIDSYLERATTARQS
jgi:integrase